MAHPAPKMACQSFGILGSEFPEVGGKLRSTGSIDAGAVCEHEGHKEDLEGSLEL